MKINSESKVPIKMWLEEIEDGALNQAKNLANLPFVFKHVAIMPDAHQGYGMPIGGVLATKDVIIPNAVGVDIGCGMCAVKTSLTTKQLDVTTLKKIMGKIREAVPVGFKHHEESQGIDLMPNGDVVYNKVEHSVVHSEFSSACKQIGTLGGGNHFIEIQRNTLSGDVWIMIHSGSRNLGKKVADHYNKVAIELNEKYYSQVLKEWELAFLPFESDEAKNYMLEMQYCVDFALANRLLMMQRIIKIFQDEFNLVGGSILGDYSFDAPKDNGIINIAHNYAKWENHFGTNVIVHRKGATSARVGEIGIIPGSQGTKSYIVYGKGNPESFQSCSHGAGRKMGRKQAERTLNLEEEIKKLNDQGIVHGIRTASDLDEASGAYKDINTVMENQKDLVEILAELSPLGVIKG